MRLVIIILCCFLASCCPRLTPVSTNKSDSVRVKLAVEYIERVRDTTIYVSVPVESHSQIVRDTSHLETGVALSDAWIGVDGMLRHSISNKVVSLEAKAVIKDTQRNERMDSVVLKEVVREIPVPAAISKLQRFWIRSGQAGWLALLILIGWRIVRRRIS